MPSIYVAFELIIGLLALTGGASVFVDGASGLAKRLHIPPVVIGLTVVALGTSAPEIGVNAVAALSGQPALAVGNVLGSNILNILVVLGLCALYMPLVVTAQVVRLDVSVMVGATLLLWLLALDGHIATMEAILLVVVLGVYTALQLVLASRTRRSKLAAQENGGADEALPPERPLLIQIGSVAVGAVLLVVGADWLVSGATAIARALEVDDRIIGLTVVAIGTSLPELAASLIATLKGERDIAIGNVVGSNIYNVLAVVGFTGIIATDGIAVPSAALALDFPVVMGATLACLPIFFSGFRIERWEGALFLASYAFYASYLILDASGHSWAPRIAESTPVILSVTVVAAVVIWLRVVIRPKARGGAA